MARMTLLSLALCLVAATIVLVREIPTPSCTRAPTPAVAQPAGGDDEGYVPERRPGTVASVAFVDLEDVDAIAERLLFSPVSDLQAFLDFRRAVGSGLVPRDAVTGAVLEALVADVVRASASGRTRLVFRIEVARILEDDPIPSPDNMLRWERYARMPTTSEAHGALRTALGGWPRKPATGDRIEALLAELAELAEPELGRRIDLLLSSGSEDDRRIVLEAARTLVASGRGEAIAAVAHGLFTHSRGREYATIVDLFGIAEGVQAAHPGDRTHSGVMSLAIYTALELQDGTGGRDEVDQGNLTKALLDATASPASSPGAAAAAAILLPSLGDGHPEGIRRLLELHSRADDDAVRSTAIVSLGRMTSPSDIVQRIGLAVDREPRDLGTALEQANYLGALATAASRHPEDADVVASAFDHLLDGWKGSPEVVALRRHLVAMLVESPIPGLEGKLVALCSGAQDDDAALAARALEALRRSR